VTVTRLWSRPLSAVVAFAALGVSAAIACGGGGGSGLKAHEAALLTDFLILAIKPEGDDKDYKLVEVGDTKVDAGLLGVVINTLPLDFLGLGGDARAYDEAAEIAQCRAACTKNSQCRDFTYARPSASQPVGVCHLRTLPAGASFGVMTPVADAGERSERPARETPPIAAAPRNDGDKIVFEDGETAGSVRYGSDDIRTTPVTLKFLAPVSQVKVRIRAGEEATASSWAQLEAFDANGNLVERTGTRISAGEFSFGHGIAVSSGGADRIVAVKVASRDGTALRLEGIEYLRTLIATAPLPAPVSPEQIPSPPRLPTLVAEHFPMPPRTTPNAPPTPITPPLPDPAAPAIETPPVLEAAAPPPASAPSTPTAAPPPVAPPRKRQLPVWLAAGAVLFVFGGAGAYWRSHRRRTLNRLTTRLVSNGLERQTVGVEASSAPDIGLRFVVRSAATIGAPGTHIELVPAGAYA